MPKSRSKSVVVKHESFDVEYFWDDGACCVTSITKICGVDEIDVPYDGNDSLWDFIATHISETCYVVEMNDDAMYDDQLDWESDR